MDEQNKGMKDRWAPPTDRGERGYSTDPGYSSGAEYSSHPDNPTGGHITDDPLEPRTAVIREEIDETRAEMRETIDAIQDRLSPGNVASRAAESVRDATVGRVKEFAGNLTGHGSSRDDRDDDWRYQSSGWDGSDGNVVLDRIRSNPMAAAMAAGSIAWLLFGNRGGGRRQPSSRSDRQRAIYGSTRGREAFVEERRIDFDQNRRAYGGGRGVDEWSAAGSDRDRESGEYGRDIADRARNAASETGDRVRSAATTVQRRTRHFASDSPFAAGAIAAAVGLAIGLAIPETERENEMLGDARDAVIDRSKEAVRTAAERVQTAAGEVQRVAGDALKGIAPGESTAGGSDETRQNQPSARPSTSQTGTTGTGVTESAVPGMQAGSGGTGATPTTKSQTGKTKPR